MKVTAVQIMIPIIEYPEVSEEVPIEKAAEILIEHFKEKDDTWRGYESLFVINKLNEKIGLLTLRSMLKAVESNEPKHNFKIWHFSKKTNNTGLKVKDLIRPIDEFFVEANDDLDQVVQLIMKKSVNSVLVRERKKFVGVIRVIDLLWFIEDLI